MQTDEIKRDFINFMENIHLGLRYPKNFFGILMALFIEGRPITQDRIEQLTGYSKTTISQTIQSLQMQIPITIAKNPGTRKKFYSIEIPLKEFMILFLRRIMDSYQEKNNFLLPLIEKVTPYIQKNAYFSNFNHFLEKFYEMSELYLKLISETADDFTNLIRTGQIRAESVFSQHILNSLENLDFIKTLMSPLKISPKFPERMEMDEELRRIYTQIKDEYYRLFRLNLTSGESQVLIARTIIGTELLLENRPLTQEDIQNATHFQRSIISDALNLLLDWNMVQMVKKTEDRKKYYIALQSWDSRMIGKLGLNIKYAITVKQKITELIEKTNTIELKEEKNMLYLFFQDLLDVFTQYDHYFKLLEWKFCEFRLQEHLRNENKKSDFV
jgi:DNA-binding transcriptional regulator GbsR (MarR family)